MARRSAFQKVFIIIFCQAFLLLEESAVRPHRAITSSTSDKSGLRLKDASARWPDGSVALNGITFRAKPGQLVIVVGPVGCGKVV